MKHIILITLMATVLLACSSEKPDDGYTSNTTEVQTPATEDIQAQELTQVTATNSDVMEIVWEDLMPEGEYERLEALYEDFFTDLEAQLLEQQTLIDAARSGDMTLADMIDEGSENDSMEQIGTFNVVEELNGQSIRIPGYVVPLDFSAKSEHEEFLLVPYFGACLHTPPPPPNQIVYVKSDPAAKVPNIYEPVWLEGILSTGEFLNDLGNSAYELSLTKIEPYEY